MKVFATFVLVLAGLVPCYADTTQTWVIAGHCATDPGDASCFDPANFAATITVTPEEGTFFQYDAGFFTGVEPVITAFSGTLDGQQITSAEGWLLPSGLPGGIGFVVDGLTYEMVIDGAVQFFPPASLLPPNSDTPFEWMDWTSAVDPPSPVPEPSAAWLLITALLSLGLMRWAQMSLRKLSER